MSTDPFTRLELTVPPGWEAIDLLAEARRGHLQARIAEAFAAHPALEGQREAMDAAARSAVGVGDVPGILGIYAFVTEAAEGLPLFAGVTVSLTAPPGPPTADLPAEREGLLAPDDDAELAAVRLAIGDGVRVKRLYPADVLPGIEPLVLLSLTYHVPLEEAGGLLTLAFSTPQAALEEELCELFDAVAARCRLTRGGRG